METNVFQDMRNDYLRTIVALQKRLDNVESEQEKQVIANIISDLEARIGVQDSSNFM